MITLRTLLFVPGNQERRIDKARSIPADAIMLDLEDSIPLAEKNFARSMVSSSIDGLALKGQEVFVRINALSTDHAAADIKAIATPGLNGICLPKSESADDILKADALITEAERAADLKVGSIWLLALVETPKGILNVYEIASASPRVLGIAFGRVVIAVACHAAGVLAIDGVYTDIRDEEGLNQDTRLARQMGFHGKLLIHPNQVSPVSQIFSPTEDEITHARGVVETFEAALTQGQASTSFEGKMIDAPVAERARKLLALAESIEKRERTG